MLSRLLPAQADNTYRGSRIALWLFALVVAFKALIGLGGIFNGYDATVNADGIPLNTWPHVAAQDFLSLSAALGFSEFMLCVVCAVVLLRYRSLVPLMFCVLFVEQVVRRFIYVAIPMIRAGHPPGGIINIVLTSLLVIGLALALTASRSPARTAG